MVDLGFKDSEVIREVFDYVIYIEKFKSVLDIVYSVVRKLFYKC